MISAISRNSKQLRKLELNRLCSSSSKEETERLAARKLRASATTNSNSGKQNKSNHSNTFVASVIGLGIVATGGAIYNIQNDRDGPLGKLYYGSQIETIVNWIDNQTFGRFREVFEPSSDKLLPDFPSPFYGNVPPGAVAPPLLVIDLERTCIGSVYDAKHGWRHVKRPGFDKFLQQLQDYYEIVIFSENDKGKFILYMHTDILLRMYIFFM